MPAVTSPVMMAAVPVPVSRITAVVSVAMSVIRMVVLDDRIGPVGVASAEAERSDNQQSEPEDSFYGQSLPAVGARERAFRPT